MSFATFPPSPYGLMGKHHISMERIILSHPADFMVFGETSVQWKQIATHPFFENLCLAYLNREIGWGDILSMNADACTLIHEGHDDIILLCFLVLSSIMGDEESQKYILSWAEYENHEVKTNIMTDKERQAFRQIVRMAKYCLEKMTCPHSRLNTAPV